MSDLGQTRATIQSQVEEFQNQVRRRRKELSDAWDASANVRLNLPEPARQPVKEAALAGGVALLAQALGARPAYTLGAFRNFQNLRRSAIDEQNVREQREALETFRQTQKATADRADNLQRLLSEETRQAGGLLDDLRELDQFSQADATRREATSLRAQEAAAKRLLTEKRNDDLRNQGQATLAQRKAELDQRREEFQKRKEIDMLRLKEQEKRREDQNARFRTTTQKFREVYELARRLGSDDTSAQNIAFDAIGVNQARAVFPATGTVQKGKSRSHPDATLSEMINDGLQEDFYKALDLLDHLESRRQVTTTRGMSQFRSQILVPFEKVEKELKKMVGEIDGSLARGDGLPKEVLRETRAKIQRQLDWLRKQRQRATPPATPTKSSLAWGGHTNGRIPDSALRQVRLAPAYKMMPEAASNLDLLLAEARLAGVDIRVTSAYRSFDHQAALRKRNPAQVAPAGRSNHGWGRAVDFTTQGRLLRFNDPAYRWLMANAPRFGFINPPLLRDGRGLDEAWHWEFHGRPR